MPLPTLDLDTRRYPDLVEEAHSLLPRYAPDWTDFNASDPGITLLELLAFLTDQIVYRTNRVPEQHRRRFLALVGFAPEPPRAAHTTLAFQPSADGDGLLLPSGIALTAEGLSFRTCAPLTLTAAALVAVQVFDGRSFVDVTRLARDRLPFDAFGSDPEIMGPLAPDEQPALYLGFDAPLPMGHETALALVAAGHRSDSRERLRIESEATERSTASARPVFPTCSEDDASIPAGPAVTTPDHHAARTQWDVHDGSGWRPLDPTKGEVDDTTRSLTLDGIVRLRPPAPMVAVAVGQIAEPRFMLRCRLAAGHPDAAPQVRRLDVNAVEAEQRMPAQQTFAIVPGTSAPATTPSRGNTARLSLRLDDEGAILSLALDSDPNAPEGLVLDYRPASAADAGALTVTLVQVGRGSGGPEQTLILPDAPVAEGQAAVWTLEPDGPHRWTAVPNLDAAGRGDELFTLDGSTGVICFGDGLRGRVPPEDAPVLAQYDTTLAAAGNVGTRSDWSLVPTTGDLNRALLGADPVTTQQLLVGVTSVEPAVDGADAESTAHAAGRAAARLWSHERLVDLCAAANANTLDQLDRQAVLALAAPPRAASLLDFERLALDVPGTVVARARAFGGLDGRFPDLDAPGTVTVVLVAGLPSARPAPSPALLDAVAAYLARRKSLGTRLVVIGPTYIEVDVSATLAVRAGADPDRARGDALTALARHLDPVGGGPLGRGWPFGRDVYRSEMLQLLAAVEGVECVDSLTLVGPDGDSCGNVCIASGGLPVSGAHTIEVRT